MGYKYCIVPECKNSTVKTPGKIFFCVPKKKEIRDKWCKLMRRDTKNSQLSSTSSVFCCEDHFKLEEDTVNYMEYRLTNHVKLRLKPGIVPTQFDCQKGEKKTIERKGIHKRRKISLLKEAFMEVELKESTNEEMDFIEENDTNENKNATEQQSEDSFLEKPKKKYPTKSKHFRSKKIGTDCVPIISTGTSPMKITCSNNKSTSTEDMPESSNHYEVPTDSDDSEFELNTIVTSSDISGEDDDEVEDIRKKKICEYTIFYIEKEPRMFLGIPKDSFYLIMLLEKESGVSRRDIYIVLKKIRINTSFSLLAIDFGLSVSRISRIFNRCLPILSAFLKTLISWPSQEDVEKNIPIPFRRRFKKVFCILDCLEIQIEKPSDSVHQALTWSNYYKCNTIKYMIASTPDGQVIFISPGFGGRATDALIVKESKLLEKLLPGCQIMADRGFKDVAPLLHKVKCSLVRPPSVSAMTRSSKDEVRVSKRIASLRIHVERVIGRVREFKMILPHSCVDNNLVRYLDEVLTTVCGILNMQDNFLSMNV